MSSKVDWSTLKHARGSASDVPQRVQDLRSDDAAVRAAAMSALELTLFSGGKWYPAAAKALPLLATLAADPSCPDRERVLVLIVDILTGDHITFVGRGLDLRDEQTKKIFARPPAKEIYKAVLGLAEVFAGLLEDPDAKVRAAAAFALSFVSGEAAASQPRLRGRLQAETDPMARASVVIALGVVDRYLGDGSDAALFGSLSSTTTEADAVRGAGVLARAHLDDRRLSEMELESCARMIRLGDLGRSGWPWMHGRPDMLVTRVLEARVTGGRPTAATLMARVVEESGPSHPLALEWTSGALDLAFPRTSQPFLAGELSADQREVVKSLSHFSLRAAFPSFGLPEHLRDRRRFIGLAEPGPLDAIVPMVVDGETREWPLWRSMNALQRSGVTAAQIFEGLESRLSKEDFVAVYAEATLYGYGTTAPWPNRLHEVIEAAGQAAERWSAQILAELLDPRGLLAATSGMGNYALIPVLARLEPTQALDERYYPLIRLAGPPDLLRRLFAAIPPEKREAFLLPQLTAARSSITQATLERVLPLFELAPTRAVTEFFLDVVAVLRKQPPPPPAVCERTVLMAIELARRYPAVAAVLAARGLAS